VQLWGNRLAVRIPRLLAAAAKLEPGSVVDISLDEDSFRVRQLRRRHYELRKLLNGVRPQNLHEEVGTGRRVGHE
jgi:antitoxin MazE